MAVSKARKAANEKWDRENMITIGCRLRKTQQEAFKRYASAQGKTMNALLKEYVLSCIGETDK